MGRMKKSIDELKASGTYRPSRHGKDHMAPEEIKTIPKPPARIENKYGAEEWKRITKELFRNGTLSRMDYGALILICNLYGLAMDTAEEVKKEHGSWGKYLLKVEGQPHAWKAYNTAFENYMKNMEKFGISPVGRSRIPVDKNKKKDNPLANFQ